MQANEIVRTHIDRGEDALTMLVNYTTTFFRYTELVWYVMDAELDYETASKIQCDFTWGGPEFAASFKAFVEENGYEIDDIQKVGKATADHYCTLPIPVYVAESSEDRVVLEADWCANPAFGGRPWDRPIDQYRYHWTDGWVGTCDLFRNNFEVAGLDKDLDFHMECAICIGSPNCRMVIEKKKKDE